MTSTRQTQTRIAMGQQVQSHWCVLPLAAEKRLDQAYLARPASIQSFANPEVGTKAA